MSSEIAAQAVHDTDAKYCCIATQHRTHKYKLFGRQTARFYFVDEHFALIIVHHGSAVRFRWVLGEDHLVVSRKQGSATYSFAEGTPDSLIVKARLLGAF
jgi:hypothetical protein